MEERFADVPGWPNYRVSSLGRLFGPRGRPLAGYIDKYGYHCAYIGPRKQGVGVKVHRLVVAAFIGPIPEGMHVNHKNGIKDDNRLDNLEVVTPQRNIEHTFDTLGRVGKNTNPVKGEKHHHSRLTADMVREIRAAYAAGATQVAIAERFGLGQNHVSRIIRRESWAHVA